jgi:ATP-dependent DNA helicase RecG
VSIGIYDDRLEIPSTGVLPFGLTLEDLTRPHPSRPWNPLIAQVFYRRGIIEAWGRGTLKIVELTRRAGLATPEFECALGEVIVRFRPTRYTPPTRVGHDLSPLQRELLEALARRGPTHLAAVRQAIGVEAAERTVRENLAVLRHLDLVESSGRGRGARWKLKPVE